MHPSGKSLSHAILYSLFTGTVVLTFGQSQVVHANALGQTGNTGAIDTLASIQFVPPGSAAPSSSIGGGTRGNVQFTLPGSAAPKTSVGGGTRGNVQFAPPGGAAPANSVGGGSRGDLQFTMPGSAAPANSVGGGSRSTNSPVLTALLPEAKYGYAVSGRPTFFVYVSPTVSQQVFFSLQDEHGNHHYQTWLNIDGRGGVVSVTLPKDAPELEVGKNYMWFFAPIATHSILTPDNPGVMGWVKRVTPPVGNPVATVSTIELATQYAKQGIWYDTLAMLASAQKTDPKNEILAKEWKELLEQVELDAVSTQPITQQL